MLQFTRGDHCVAQLQRFCCNGETKRGEACVKAHQPQHAQRVFGESGRNVAQHPCLHIGLTAVRVNQPSVGRLRHRVDGQIAAQQIRFQRHLRRKIEGEGLVPAPGLALLPCQCIFLARLWMQKHRKILADLTETLRQHFFRRCADHDPIAVMHRQAEQSIAHRAADQKNLHCILLQRALPKT